MKTNLNKLDFTQESETPAMINGANDFTEEDVAAKATPKEKIEAQLDNAQEDYNAPQPQLKEKIEAQLENGQSAYAKAVRGIVPPTLEDIRKFQEVSAMRNPIVAAGNAATEFISKIFSGDVGFEIKDGAEYDPTTPPEDFDLTTVFPSGSFSINETPKTVESLDPKLVELANTDPMKFYLDYQQLVREMNDSPYMAGVSNEFSLGGLNRMDNEDIDIDKESMAYGAGEMTGFMARDITIALMFRKTLGKTGITNIAKPSIGKSATGTVLKFSQTARNSLVETAVKNVGANRANLMTFGKVMGVTTALTKASDSYSVDGNVDNAIKTGISAGIAQYGAEYTGLIAVPKIQKFLLKSVLKLPVKKGLTGGVVKVASTVADSPQFKTSLMVTGWDATNQWIDDSLRELQGLEAHNNYNMYDAAASAGMGIILGQLGWMALKAWAVVGWAGNKIKTKAVVKAMGQNADSELFGRIAPEINPSAGADLSVKELQQIFERGKELVANGDVAQNEVITKLFNEQKDSFKSAENLERIIELF